MKDSIVEKYFCKKIKIGNRNLRKIDKLFGCPSKKFLSIHVGGTNGKGSLTEKISNVLIRSSYKVGIFTSPHIVCFRERIRLGNKKIPVKDVQRITKELDAICKKWKLRLTFFEAMVMIAFIYFAEKKVDFAVIEVGIGGRRDATNILKNTILSVITSISLDHTDILGDSLDKIAKEKAGIIKKGIPCVIGPLADRACIIEESRKKKSPLYKAQEVEGEYDRQNSKIAEKCLDVLKKRVRIEKAAEIGLLQRPKCRMETFFEDHKIMKNFSKKPFAVILDVAHNVDGFQKLFASIRKLYPKRIIRVVLGISKDKDVLGCLEVVLKYAQKVVFVDEGNERLEKKERLLSFCEGHMNVFAEKMREAIFSSQKGEILLICGSFFIMKGVKKYLDV